MARRHKKSKSPAYKRHLKRVHRNAAELRRRPTRAEAAVAKYLRGESVYFKEQFVVFPFILDFYLTTYQIGIEVDGTIRGYHATPSERTKDRARDKSIRERAPHVRMVRISNEQALSSEMPQLIKRAVRTARRGSTLYLYDETYFAGAKLLETDRPAS